MFDPKAFISPISIKFWEMVFQLFICSRLYREFNNEMLLLGNLIVILELYNHSVYLNICLNQPCTSALAVAIDTDSRAGIPKLF